MANHYFEFSEVLPFDDDPRSREVQRAWCEEQITTVLLPYPGDPDPDDPDAEFEVCRFLVDFFENARQSENFDLADFDNAYPGFGCDIEPDGVWIHSCDDGDSTAFVGQFVQKFLAAHRPHGIFFLTGANVCSRPLAGAFGGGLLVVTANDIVGLNTYFLKENYAAAHEALGFISVEPTVSGGDLRDMLDDLETKGYGDPEHIEVLRLLSYLHLD